MVLSTSITSTSADLRDNSKPTNKGADFRLPSHKRHLFLVNNMKTEIKEKWDALEAEINRRGGDGADFVAAMQELYAIWDERLYLWCAGSL